MRSVRAAVVQAGPVPFDCERSVAKAIEYMEGASAQGAAIAVFPEAFLSGYPKFFDFGAVVGRRTDEGRALFRRYFESAIDVPGPVTERLGEACRNLRLNLVIGVIEREGGTLYCTALYFSDEGQLLGKHRKVMPTAAERVIWGCGDGSTLKTVDTTAGRVGTVICWENYMPFVRMAMYEQGVQLYCAPTVDDRETWTPTMRHIAFEGRCFVLSAVQYLRQSDLPADIVALLPAGAPDPLIRGGSVIVSPMGRVLAGPSRDGECILVADLDLDEIIEGKFDLDVVGHYARPDIFEWSWKSEY